MASLTINLTDDLKRLADARAVAAGYTNVGDYVGALILADAGDSISPELEAHLLSAMQTQSKEVSPAYWEAKRQQLAKIHHPGC